MRSKNGGFNAPFMFSNSTNLRSFSRLKPLIARPPIIHSHACAHTSAPCPFYPRYPAWQSGHFAFFPDSRWHNKEYPARPNDKLQKPKRCEPQPEPIATGSSTSSALATLPPPNAPPRSLQAPECAERYSPDLPCTGQALFRCLRAPALQSQPPWSRPDGRNLNQGHKKGRVQMGVENIPDGCSSLRQDPLEMGGGRRDDAPQKEPDRAAIFLQFVSGTASKISSHLKVRPNHHYGAVICGLLLLPRFRPAKDQDH